MNIGVSTACLYPMPTELALKALAEQGIKAVEIFVNASSEYEQECLINMRRIIDKYGVKVVAIHPFSSAFEPLLFFTGYERRVKDSFKMYEGIYKASRFLGAEIIVLHGDHRRGAMTDNEYFERYGEMFRHAQQNGVLLAQENVERCRSRSVDFIKRMHTALGSEVRFVLDQKQAIRSGETAFTMLEAMGNAVCHLHISDSNSTHDCLPPGSGDFEFSELFKRVKAVSNEVYAIVELYRDNYDTTENLYTSYSFLKAIP